MTGLIRFTMIIKPWPADQSSQEHPTNSDQKHIIYHYTSLETAVLIITGQTLRFSHPAMFNDPLDLYDGLIDFEGTPQQITKWVDDNIAENERESMLQMMLEPTVAKNIFEQSISRTKEGVGICCFSKEFDQVLMWSHYAQKHKGVCLGFSFMPNQSILSDNDFLVCEVNYPDQIQSKSYFDIEEAVNHWVFTKSPCWAYEKEVRATINGMSASPDIQFDKECLKEIYFGCRTTAAQRASLTKLLKANGFSLDTWQQMQIDDATFSVKAVPYEISTT